MKAKTVIMKLKMLEYMLTDHLGHDVKLTYSNIDDYERDIKDFDNHFNEKLIERDKRACYFEKKSLPKVA